MSSTPIEGKLDSNSPQLESKSYYNTHAIAGQAGEEITIDLTSRTLDPYLILRDANNTQIAEDDDGGAGTNARIIITFPSTGTYTIVATTYDAKTTGSYTLSWHPTTAEDRALAEAEQLNAEVERSREQARYSTALPLAQRALELWEKTLGPEHPEVALGLDSLARLYQATADYPRAEPLFQRALAIREKVFDSQDSSVALSLNNLATLYWDTGNYSAAEPLYQRALEIWEKTLGSEHPYVAAALDNLAKLYRATGRATAAIPLAQRALSIRESRLGPEHSDVAFSLDTLGNLYLEMGRYREAEPLFQRAIAIREKIFGTEHPDIATSANNLAQLYQKMGNYPAAEPLQKRAIAIVEKAFGPEHSDVAIYVNNLAELYREIGNYKAAEPLYQRSLAIKEKVFGPKHPSLALSLNNLAVFYEDTGNYVAAEPLLQRALKISEQAFGENVRITRNLNNLAELYRTLGDYKAAEPLYQRALAIREKVLGPEHPDVATLLNNLAMLYQDRGDYKAAEPLYQRSLAIWEKALGANHPTVATNLNNLASLYQETGNYTAAESLYQRSLTIRQQAFGPESPDVAASLNNLAMLYRHTGKFSEAESLLQQSLGIWEKTLPADHPNIATNLGNSAILFALEGKIPRALADLTRTTEIEERNLALNASVGSEEQKRAYLETLAKTTDFALSFHLQSAPNNPAAARLALTTLLRRKGRVLDTLAESLNLLRQNLTPENQALLDRLAERRSQLAALIYRQPAHLPAEQYRQQVAALKAEAETLESQLARRSAEFRIASEPVTMEAVQALIPADRALVEIAYYRPSKRGDRTPKTEQKPRYVAYILKSTGEPQAVDLGEAEVIDKAIVAFRGGLTNQARRSLAKTTGRKLDALLMQPIRAQLGGTKRLLISPDGELNRIPFAALTDENDRYLLDNYQITYLTTGRELLRFDLDRGEQTAPVVMANPDYDRATESPAAAPIASKNRRSAALDLLTFVPLPGTAAEADAIAPLLPQVALLTRDRATETALKQVRSPSILHIATHGFFLEVGATAANPARSENPLLRSGLALAGANARRSGNDDGILTALEAAQLNLRGTDLVVLSACETGLGETANGEGVYGLRRAIAIAGARSQIMSLWSVSDAGTKELMANYYRRLLQGEERGEALRQVQLELLKGEQYNHPFFWAAFIPSGDWREVSPSR